MTIPRSTLAAVLTAHGSALELQELPLPEQLEPGAALVRITCTTLCGTDIEIWAGKMSFPGMLPMVLGHEMVGEIVAVGEGAVDALGAPLAIGDRIGWSESVCGTCFGCTVLRQPVACSSRGYGFLQRSDVPPYATAGLSEYAYVTPGAQKLRLPAEVKDTWASAAGCAAKTVLRAFDRAGGVRPGSRVVVQGSGALGLFATAVASISGAGTVITVGAPPRGSPSPSASAPTIPSISPAAPSRPSPGCSNSPTARSRPRARLRGRPRHRPRGHRHGRPARRLRRGRLDRRRGRSLPALRHHAQGAHRRRLPQRRRLRLLPLDRVLPQLRGPLPLGRTLLRPCGLDEASAKIANMHELGEVKAVIDPRLTVAR